MAHELQLQNINPTFGAAPYQHGNSYVEAILGYKSKQTDYLYPYEANPREKDHIHHYNAGADLGRHVLMDLAKTSVTIAMLLPLVDLPPDLTYLKWEIEHWRPVLIRQVPEEGVFDEIMHATESRQVSVQRRGAAISATANVLHTEQGRQRLASQIAKLAASILYTMEFLTLQALLGAMHGVMFRIRSMGNDKNKQRQIEWAAAQAFSWTKNPMIAVGFDTNYATTVLGQHTVGPYAFLVPEEVMSILDGFVQDTSEGMMIQTLDTSNRIMDVKSPRSNITFRDGSKAFPVTAHGSPDDTTRYQELRGAVNIAEKYHMTGTYGCTLTARTGHVVEGEGFRTCQRDLDIYSTKSDNFECVSFAEAFRNSCFVPKFKGDVNYTERFLGRLREDDFHGSKPTTGRGRHSRRAAPSNAYWDYDEKKGKLVEYFGQFDRDIVSAKGHRMVGETLAAFVLRKNSSAGKAIEDGISLLRELEAAEYSSEFFGLYDGIRAEAQAAGPLPTLGDEAPDLVAAHRLAGDTVVIPQDALGVPPMSETVVSGIIDWISKYGLPPGMASLAGLNFLARIGRSTSQNSTIRDIGSRAKRAVDALRLVYTSLLSIFPQAAATSPLMRPRNYLKSSTGGFAAWFSTAFLSAEKSPIFMGGFMTPLVATVGLVSSVPAAFGDGTPVLTVQGRLSDPMSHGPISDLANVGNIYVESPAHTRTPWGAVYGRWREQLARESFAQATSGGSSRIPVADDMSSSARRGRRRRRGFAADDVMALRTTPSGAPLDGLRGGDGRDAPQDAATIIAAMNLPSVLKAIDEADKIKDQLSRMSTITYLTAPCTHQEHFDAMLDNDIWVPFDIKLDRVHCVIEAYSVIAMKPGIETGINGVTDTALYHGRNVDQQTDRWTMSYSHTSAIIRPNNVIILMNRIPVRSCHGDGVELFTDPSQISAGNGSRPDLIPVVVPMGSKFELYEPQGGIDFDGIYGQVGSARFPGAALYNEIWRIGDMVKKTRACKEHYKTFKSAMSPYAWTGSSIDSRGKYTNAAGERKDAAFKGCRAVWNGLSHKFPAFNPQISL